MATKAKPSVEVQLHGQMLVPIGNLVPTKHNPRHFHKDAAFKELRANMGASGLDYAVIARSLERGSSPQDPEQTIYELLAGRRRWEAAKDLGWTHVPTIVRVLDDKEARELTVRENVQRQDLTPLEESNGVQSLLDVGFSAEEVADRFGKTAKWVARRARLRELHTTWQKHLDNPGHWTADYSAGHLEVIAALPSEVQAQIFKELEDQIDDFYRDPVPPVDQFRKDIAREYLHTLAAASWDLADDTLVPEAGACTSCPKRSSVQPLLFDDPDPDSKAKTARDHCLDDACWKRKGAELANRSITELTVGGKKPLQIFEHGCGVEPRDAESASNYKTVKANEKGAVQAVVVAGPAAGETRWVKPQPWRSTRPESSSSGVRTAGRKMTDKEKRAGLEKRRRVWVINEIRQRIEASLDGKTDAGCATVEQIQEDALYTNDALRYVLAFGTHWRADSSDADTPGSGKRDDHAAGWPALEAMKDATDNESFKSAWRHVLRVWVSRLGGHGVIYQFDRVYADAKKMCPLLAIDFDEVRAAAEKAIPTPKSWAAKAPAKNPKKPKAAKASTASKASKRKTKKASGKKSPASKAAKKPKQPNIYEAVASKRGKKPKALAEDDPRRKCRVCGCTWTTPCTGGCYWVEDDLCSACEHDPRAKKVNQHIHDTFCPAGIAEKEAEQAPLNAHTGKPDPVLGILSKGRKHKPNAAAAAVRERTKGLESPGKPSKKPKPKSKASARKAVAV